MATFMCRLDHHEPGDARPIEVNVGDNVDFLHRGREAARAAEKFVERYDRDAVEYPPEREVIVRHPDGREETFAVELVAVPEYHAKVKKVK